MNRSRRKRNRNYSVSNEYGQSSGLGALLPLRRTKRFSRHQLVEDEFCPHVFRLASKGKLADLEKTYGQQPSRITVTDSRKKNVLHHAAVNGHVAVINFCIKSGAEINGEDDEKNSPLHVAVFNKQKDAVKFLLEAGANPNVLNKDLCSPLYLAVLQNDFEIIKVICSFSNTDINMKNGEKQGTALHLAVVNDKDDIIILLLDSGANINAACKKGGTATHCAASCGSIKALQALIDYGKKHGTLKELINFPDYEKTTPIHGAVSSGDTEIVKLCIKAGANIEAHQEDLLTPLHLACAKGDKHMVEAIIDSLNTRCANDANCQAINFRDKQSMTPLHHAAMFDHASLVEFLLDSGADIDTPDMFKRTAVLVASSKNAYHSVQILLSRGANVLLKDNLDRSFLHLAIINNVSLSNFAPNFGKYVTMLLNEKDCYGCTPLHYASKLGYLNPIKILIDHGVDLNTINKNYESPLHFAARYGRYQSCKRLLDSPQGPNILNQTDRYGQSPLHKAADQGHVKVVQLLMKYGAVFHRDYDGNHPLHLAAKNGYTKTGTALLCIQTHVLNSKNNTGATALHLAASEGHQSMVTYLMDTEAMLDVTNYDGDTFFDLVIKEKMSDVGLVIVQNRRWQEAMALSSKEYVTPFLGLVKELPDVCMAVLDQCQKLIRSEQYKCGKTMSTWQYDFRLLQMPMKKMTSLRREGKDFVPLYALNKMLYFERIKCLSHPVVTNYLQMKWNAYGKLCHTANLFLYAVFLAILTLMVAMPPATVAKHLNSTNATVTPKIKVMSGHHRKVELAFIILGLLFCFMNMVKEIVQMQQQRMRYIAELANNTIEWCLYISSAVFFIYRLVPELLIQCPGLIVSGAVASLLAWVNLLLFFERSDRFGIYVVMYWEILKTLLEVVVVFSALFVAFGLAFYVLVISDDYMIGFSTPAWSLFRIAFMTLGQMEDLMEYLPNRAQHSTVNLTFQPAVIVMIVIFVLCMPILLMNLLIGLAVGDIGSIQKDARIKRIAMQIEFHSELERKLPPGWLERSDKIEYTVGPTDKDNFFIVILKVLTSCCLRPDKVLEDGQPSETQHQSALYEEIYKQKQRIKDVTTMMEKQHHLLKLIVQKMEIENEADEVDEDPTTSTIVKKWKQSTRRQVGHQSLTDTIS